MAPPDVAPAPITVWISSMNMMAPISLDLAHHRLEPLLEIAAITRAGEQRAHVELEDGGIGQHFGTSPMTMRRARPSAIAVLPTPGSPTKSGLFFWRRHRTWMVRWIFRPASDQGIDAARAGFLVEVDAVDFERIGAALLLVALDRRRVVVHPRTVRVRHPGPLGDAVADIVDRIEAGHVLLLQEEGGGSGSAKMATSTLAPVTSSRPEDCTWATARE